MITKDKLAELITTFLYIGKVKYFPGTLGALCAYPLIYLVINYFPLRYFNIFETKDIMLTAAIIVVVLWLILLFVGIYFSNIYIKLKNIEDPQDIIIDEVAGQVLTILLCWANLPLVMNLKLNQYIGEDRVNFIFLFILPLLLFRIFDIIKPWPINWIDQKVKGGLGVMLDDQLAAVFAAVINYVIVFCVIDYIG